MRASSVHDSPYLNASTWLLHSARWCLSTCEQFIFNCFLKCSNSMVSVRKYACTVNWLEETLQNFIPNRETVVLIRKRAQQFRGRRFTFCLGLYWERDISERLSLLRILIAGFAWVHRVWRLTKAPMITERRMFLPEVILNMHWMWLRSISMCCAIFARLASSSVWPNILNNFNRYVAISLDWI